MKGNRNCPHYNWGKTAPREYGVYCEYYKKFIEGIAETNVTDCTSCLEGERATKESELRKKYAEGSLVKLQIKKLVTHAVIPKYETEGSAGFDLTASETVIIQHKETKLVPTGLVVAVPFGYELQIRPRSGLSLNTYLRVANAPGTIDSDYRGEVKIIVENTSPYKNDVCKINRGERIAQAVLNKVPQAYFEEVDELDETVRGSGGFGSTGKGGK